MRRLQIQLDVLRTRLAALQQESGGQTDELVEQAIEGVATAIEELIVAQEELQAQHAALAEERARYQLLFDLAPEAYIVTDASGKILNANAAALDMLAVGGRFLVGKLLVSLVVPDDRRLFRALLTRVLRERGDRHSLTLRLRDRAREVERDVELTVAAEGWGSGLNLRWLLRDVTEQRAAERELGELATQLASPSGDAESAATAIAQLAAERNQLRTVLDRLGQGIIAVDRDLKVQVANAPSSRLLGVTVRAGRALPEPWPELLSLRDVVLDALVAGIDVERQLVLPDDRVVSVAAVSTGPRRDAAVVVVSDLSERERAERVEREFVANASHELRTPLATIIGAIEVLQAGAKEQPETRDRFLRHIEREVDRLSRLVNALLIIARVQARHELPELGPVAVRPLLDQVAEHVAAAPDVEVSVACPRSLSVVGEPDLLLEILTNLATNAAKHTDSGQIVFSAAAARGVVSIEVRDTGAGVSAAEQDMLFRRFYRAGDRSRDGFGLGLAIVREAVAALGGGVEIESEPGHGTRVRVTLPVARQVAA